MTQRDRDRLVVLKKAQKKLIQQGQAAAELGITIRQVKRLLRRLKEEGDKAVVHGLRGRTSNRKLTEATREKIVRILSQEAYQGFGPTLASEYLEKKHDVRIGREALRKVMMGAGLWRSRRQKVSEVHQWRTRRSCRGELVQWDTSEHDWLEGRGDGKLYLIAMIDDASSELTARFAAHDSTQENLRLLRSYLEQHGRPVSFYTDKASLFQTAEKRRRDQPGKQVDAVEMPPTQICRALRELGIAWIPAHSPQAKGRIERSFATAQDRLVKGLRIAKVKTLEQANRYLQEEFVPWWNQHLTVIPAHATDAHRLLTAEHDLDAVLSVIQTRQVNKDYTIHFQGKLFQIVKAEVRHGLRGATVQIQMRLDGSMHVRFQGRYLKVELCEPAIKAVPVRPVAPASRARKPVAPSVKMRRAMKDLIQSTAMPVWQAAQIDRTRTSDVLD